MPYTLVRFEELFASGSRSTCIGYTSDSRRCNSLITQENLRVAETIWDAIMSGANATYVERGLENLATRCLCKRDHQDQKNAVVKAWTREIERSTEAGFTGQAPANDPMTAAQEEQVITQLKLERDFYHQRFLNQSRQCQSLESVLDDTRDALASLQEEYDETRTKFRKAKSETFTLELQIDVFKQGMEDLEESNTYLRFEFITAERLTASLQREVNTQERKQTQLSDELQQSYEANKMLQDNISVLMSTLQESNTSVAYSGLRIAILEKRLKTIKSSAKSACKHRSSLLSANTKLTSELIEAKDTIEQLEKRAAVLEANVMESSKVSMSQQQVSDHEKTINCPGEGTSQIRAQGCAREDEKDDVEADTQKRDKRFLPDQQCELM